MTDNHGYNTPSKGTSDWNVPLNENFTRLDRDVEVRDTEANLGNYSPKQGAKFLATDTGKRFIGDGSNWNSLSYPGSASPNECHAHVCKQGGKTVAVDQYQSIIYSGKPAATIEAAIEHAYNLTGNLSWGIVEVAAGTYTLEKEIFVDQAGSDKMKVVLKGQAKTSVTLDASDLSGGNALNQEGAQHFRVQGFTIDGGGQNVNLVWAKNAPVNQWVDMKLRNSTGHGMYLEDNLNSEIIRVRVNDCGAADNGTYGMWMFYGDQGGDYSMFDSRVINTGDSRSDPGGATALHAHGARLKMGYSQFKTNVDEDIINAGSNNYWWRVDATAPSSSAGSGAAALRLTGGENRIHSSIFEKKDLGIVLDSGTRSRFIDCMTRLTTTAGVFSSGGGGLYNEFISHMSHQNSGDGVNVDPTGPMVFNGGYFRKNDATDFVGNSNVLVTSGAVVGSINGDVINDSPFA